MIISSILAIETIYTFFRYGVPPIFGLCSVFNQFNHYGYYLAVSCTLSAAYIIFYKKSFLAYLSFVLNTFALIFNDTFGAWLAVLFALVFSVITNRIVYNSWSKKSIGMIGLFLLITILGGIIGGGIFISLDSFASDVGKVANASNDIESANSAGMGRIKIWKTTIQYIKEKPLFGWGIEGTDQMLMRATGSSRPHNEYLTYAVFFGIPAMIFYLCGVMSVFFHNLKYKNELSKIEITCMITAFAYLVSAFFGNIKSYTAPLLFIFLGMAYHIKYDKDDEESTKNIEE